MFQVGKPKKILLNGFKELKNIVLNKTTFRHKL
jgi:hypothetical protein